ncbi:MAG TPA: hypothetical protein VH084_21985 [Mycobacterium sp.]|jgi:hypothetical protein|nr:hypothetical protein [Mycobacterium sp.]
MAETTEKVDTKKAEAEAAKEAEEQAKQNEADLETFASFHRGEALARGEGGSLDLPAFLAAREAAKDAD